MNKVMIDGIEYVEKSAQTEGMPYVIARCKDAGVHAGYLESDTEEGVVLKNSRRIYYWAGAASLSEIAVYGCKESSHDKCKFACEVERLKLRTSDVCEIIHCTDAGQKMIEGIDAWRA